MVHAISLFAALFAVWLLLSGMFSPFFLALAAAACALVVYVAHRMDVVDHEGHPVHLSWRLATYLPWLAWEIVRANLYVARRIVARDMAIDPNHDWLPASQETEVGIVIYANSITLTPGTVSTSVEPGRIMVHSLTGDLREDLVDSGMDARVRAVEG